MIVMRKRSAVAALTIGLVLIVVSGLVRWVAAPRMAVLPADLQTVRVYTGTAATLVNPTSLMGTTIGPGLLRDVAVTVRHSTKVVQTSGHAALVADERAVSIPGYTVADLNYRFGINRSSFQAAGAFPGAVAHRGLTINWPIGAGRHDYTGWVTDTQSSTRLRYVGEQSRGGIPTYVFRTLVAESPITDPQLLRLLPRSMSKSALMTLTPSLGLSRDALLKMSKVVDRLPDPVPLVYTYQLAATYWVAPASGVVVDTVQHEVRSVSFVDGAATVPVTPVMDMTYHSSAATLAAAVNDAKDNAAAIRLVETTVPVGLLIGGIVLAMAGLALALTKRPRRPSTPVPSVPQRELVRIG
jgi:hypothetical protein